MQWLDQEEKLEPLSPPPAPQAPPDVPVLRFTQHHGLNQGLDKDEEERLTPQCPPMPHPHPLVALSDESIRNVKLQEDQGGMALHSCQQLLEKQFHSTYPSRERVQAMTERVEESNAFAVEREHSIALEGQRQEHEMKQIQLSEHERTMAATEASARRHDLLKGACQAARDSTWRDKNGETDPGVKDSALARASERKVSKQLSVKWMQTRLDPSNRPRGPLERPEEHELRETLFRTTASDLLRSGVLYDEADAARNATFGPMSITQLPVISSGIVGLAGCCFETYHDEY